MGLGLGKNGEISRQRIIVLAFGREARAVITCWRPAFERSDECQYRPFETCRHHVLFPMETVPLPSTLYV